jgi:type IV secretory pathway VirB2 component (pilin)
MKINYWQILTAVLVAAAALVVPVDVWAAGGDPFDTLCDRVQGAWDGGRKIVYIIGGIAALTLGVLAFFGRFKWTTFFALVGGIFLIAIFDQVLQYAGAGGTYAENDIGC